MLKRLRQVEKKIFKWEIEIQVSPGPAGRVHRTIEDTEAGATAIYAELLHQKNRASFGMDTKRIIESVSIDAAAAEYERHMLRVGISASHISHTTAALNLLRETAGKDTKVNHITTETLIAWQTARALKPFGLQKKLPSNRTVNKDFDSISGFLTWCYEQRHWISENPARQVTRYDEKAAPIKFQEWQDFEKFVESAWDYRPALALLLEVAGESGCRVGEAIAAKVKHVDPARKQWTKVVKGGRLIVVPAGPFVLAAAEGRDSESPLCAREDGKHFLYHVIERAFAGICARARVPLITPHVLRHGRAVWDIEADIPIYFVSKKLGHTTVKTTEIYLKYATRRGQPERIRHPIDPRMKSLGVSGENSAVLGSSTRSIPVPPRTKEKPSSAMKKA